MKTTLFTLFFLPLVAASAWADNCPKGFDLDAAVTEPLFQKGATSYDLKSNRVHHDRIQVILKLEVSGGKVPGQRCTFRARKEIDAGQPNEQTVTILVTAKVNDAMSTGKYLVDKASIQMSISYDVYSTLNPTFNDLMAKQNADLDARGLGVKGKITDTFRDLRPALAVRGAACLMCHAKVDANMITDFGYGDPYFFTAEGDGPSVYGPFTGRDGVVSHYSWQLATVSKTLFIPRGTITRKKNAHELDFVDDSGKSAISIARYLKMPFQSGDGAMAQGVRSVVQKKSIYIGAPTATEILELAPSLKAKKSGFAVVGVEDAAKAVQPQLKVANPGGANEYVTNAQPVIDCDGDIVIKGTLFLNQVTFSIKEDGCRLYVSDSVFIQEPPRYKTTGTEYSAPAAQITSARAILMGFNTGTLSKRLGTNGENPHILALETTRAGPASTTHPKINADAAKIGARLVDAGDEVRSFKGLLLNAPEIYSRYRGPFSGSIIAEIALLRPGEFSFTFDDNVLISDFFPMLKRPILKLSDDEN